MSRNFLVYHSWIRVHVLASAHEQLKVYRRVCSHMYPCVPVCSNGNQLRLHLHSMERTVCPFRKCVRKLIGVSLCSLSVTDLHDLLCGQRKRSGSHTGLMVTLSPSRPGLKDSERQGCHPPVPFSVGELLKGPVILQAKQRPSSSGQLAVAACIGLLADWNYQLLPRRRRG